MPSAYRKMLGARPLTNWTIIDIWRPPRVGAAHLTEKLPLDPDSEGELDAIVKRIHPGSARLARPTRRKEATQWLDKSELLDRARWHAVSAAISGRPGLSSSSEIPGGLSLQSLGHGFEGERGDVEVLFASHHLSQRLSDRGRVFEAVSRAW